MSALVTGLILLSALMHAGWNFLVKKSSDGQLDTVGFSVGCSIIAAWLLPIVGLPNAACYPWLAATLVVHVAYFILLAEAYQQVDFSLAYPLMRGTAPLLVALMAPVLGEVMSAGQIMGVVMIGLGLGLPAWIGKPWQTVKPRGLMMCLLNAVVIACYTVLDGIGVRLSGDAVAYTLWLFLFNSWGILAVIVWRRSWSEVSQHIRQGWRLATLGAGMSMASYGIVLWAMTQATIPAVAALREMSVVFAALLGAWFLREQMGIWRIVGAAFVGVGAATIRWV
jgi:drug/metabolite transporter (DMT)-like permease